MGSMISDWMDKRRAGKSKSKVRSEPMTGLEVPENMALESPYVAGRREWNERYGSYIARARTWQIVALASIALSGVLTFNLVDLAKATKVKPYVVEVNKLGEAIAVKPADLAAVPDQKIVSFQLANFITNARSITPDRVVQKRWLDSVYAISSAPAATFLNDYYKKNDPFDRGRTTLVSVELQGPPLPISDKSWQIQWTETTRGLNGVVDGVTRHQAVIVTSIFEPTTPQQIIANPTGVVIDQITWREQF